MDTLRRLTRFHQCSPPGPGWCWGCAPAKGTSTAAGRFGAPASRLLGASGGHRVGRCAAAVGAQHRAIIRHALHCSHRPLLTAPSGAHIVRAEPLPTNPAKQGRWRPTLGSRPQRRIGVGKPKGRPSLSTSPPTWLRHCLIQQGHQPLADTEVLAPSIAANKWGSCEQKWTRRKRP